ncbi:hypothetical protein Ddc_14708 [Ditylenchus destructor]|nr:hypothetical protein Ddc_14708 [Ditylenchus destructor]
MTKTTDGLYHQAMRKTPDYQIRAQLQNQNRSGRRVPVDQLDERMSGQCPIRGDPVGSNREKEVHAAPEHRDPAQDPPGDHWQLVAQRFASPPQILHQIPFCLAPKSQCPILVLKPFRNFYIVFIYSGLVNRCLCSKCLCPYLV